MYMQGIIHFIDLASELLQADLPSDSDPDPDPHRSPNPTPHRDDIHYTSLLPPTVYPLPAEDVGFVVGVGVHRRYSNSQQVGLRTLHYLA